MIINHVQRRESLNLWNDLSDLLWMKPNKLKMPGRAGEDWQKVFASLADNSTQSLNHQSGLKWTLDACTAVTDADSACIFVAPQPRHSTGAAGAAGAFLQHGEQPESHACMIYFRWGSNAGAAWPTATAYSLDKILNVWKNTNRSLFHLLEPLQERGGGGLQSIQMLA